MSGQRSRIRKPCWKPFERERFSAAYLAETTRDERSALLAEIAAAAAQAGGIMVDAVGDDIHLVLHGRETKVVVFRPESRSPFAIDALRVQAGAPPLQLGWDDLAAHFAELERNGFAGVVHASRDGDTVLERAYGKSNRELGYDTNLDTVYGIGSTPIDFTVSAIFLLAQQEKIALDEPVSSYLDGVPEDKRGMTVRHLISGASGLPDFHDRPGDWDADLAWIDRETAVQRILAQPLLFAPGSSNAHSHSAYGLAAAVIERVSNETYFDFLRKNFLEPAGMSRTGMYGTDLGLGIREFAVGYGPSSVGVPNIPPNWGPTSWLVLGSGGMSSTLGDMLRFYAFVRSGKLLEERFARRYLGEGVGIGGSERGFFFFHANRGSDAEVMVLVNGEGRTPAMQALVMALEGLVMRGD